MSPIKVHRIAALLAAVMTSACDASDSTTSRVEHRDLVFTFTPACVDGEIQLRGEIFNRGANDVRIESGTLPWDYGVLGTDFQAEAAGKPLVKNQAAPLIGKTGPKVLKPNERRHGITPIEFIFPELKKVLATQLVTVRWSFPFASPVQGAEPIVGHVEIPKDPCGL
jgi:hypothetical protein